MTARGHTSGGLAPTLRRQVDTRQRTAPTAKVASGPNRPLALQIRLGVRARHAAPSVIGYRSSRGRSLMRRREAAVASEMGHNLPPPRSPLPLLKSRKLE